MYKVIKREYFIKGISYLIVVIYFIFLYIDALSKDLGNVYSLRLKYLIIILCFGISLLIGSKGYSKEDKLLVQLARVFTLIADYYFVIYGDFEPGIFFFSLVQIIYIIRHSIWSKGKCKNIVFFIIALTAALIISLNIKSPFIKKNLIILVFIYAALLLTSLYSSISTVRRGKYPKKASWMIAIGILLFFMCDLNVGLFNILEDGNIKFYIGYLIWLFYGPSQLLLTLSGFKVEFLEEVFKIKNSQ